jgi:ketosteroid isomerase-like protein
VSGLEERIGRLEDLEAIRDVTARYANAVNRGYEGKKIDYAALSSVYTEDAVWRSASMNIHEEGRDNLIASLRQQEPLVEIALHGFVNPVIDLDGDTATGQWVMPIGSFHDGKSRAVFMSSDFGYRRTADGWRIASVDVSFAVMLAVLGPTRGLDLTPGLALTAAEPAAALELTPALNRHRP